MFLESPAQKIRNRMIGEPYLAVSKKNEVFVPINIRKVL
jgi:hypothetical protein